MKCFFCGVFLDHPVLSNSVGHCLDTQYGNAKNIINLIMRTLFWFPPFYRAVGDLVHYNLRWVCMPNMSCVRDRASAASMGNSIYVFGGRDEFMADKSLKTGEMFTGDGWKRLPGMRVGRLDLHLVALPI